ncbi:MAG: AbrB/MazE/SpoVT family DNA-binding domain-containing protein [Pyrobaculum sp.]
MAKNRFLRKVQKIKTGSYMVSLPMEWVKKNNIGQHTPVYVIEDPNNNIVVKIPTLKCIVEMDVEGLHGQVLEDVLKIMYMQGVSRIVLKSKSGFPDSILRVVRSLRQDLIGFEIEDLNFNEIRIEIKDSIEFIGNDQFLKYFKKSLKYLNSSLEELLKYDGSNGLHHIKEKLLEGKRTYRYLARLLSLALREPERNGLPASLQILYIENVVRLREIAYYIHRMIDFVEGLKNEELGVVKPLIEKAMQAIDVIIKEEDMEKIRRIRDEVNHYEESLIAHARAPRVLHSAFALRRIVHNILRIAENMYVARVASQVNCVAEFEKIWAIQEET